MWQTAPEATAIVRLDSPALDSALREQALLMRRDWPDETLMAAVATNDELAFAVIYQRYADLVYSASLRVLGDPQLAEDATQDVFVRIWRRPETFVAQRGRFVSWLMSVARNRAVDELRARMRRRRREGTSLPEANESAVPVYATEQEDPQLSVEHHEDRRTIRTALALLPSDQRVALELAYFGGLTQQEIATALHEPLGTVKTRMRLGMQKLRRAIEAPTRF